MPCWFQGFGYEPFGDDKDGVEVVAVVVMMMMTMSMLVMTD